MKKANLSLLLASAMLLAAFAALVVTFPRAYALMRPVADGIPGAMLAADEHAALGLSGFHADAYDLTTAYQSTGSITNRFQEPLQLAVRLAPTVTRACKWVNQADKCVPGKVQLELCIASAPQTGGAECRGQVVSLSDSTGSQWIFLSQPTAPGRSVYVSVRGDVNPEIKGDPTICAYSDFEVAGLSVVASGASENRVQVSSTPEVPRRQVYRMGNCS